MLPNYVGTLFFIGVKKCCSNQPQLALFYLPHLAYQCNSDISRVSRRNIYSSHINLLKQPSTAQGPSEELKNLSGR
jgi:hypothetical protein